MRLGKGWLRSCFGFDVTVSRSEIEKEEGLESSTWLERMVWVASTEAAAIDTV